MAKGAVGAPPFTAFFGYVPASLGPCVPRMAWRGWRALCSSSLPSLRPPRAALGPRRRGLHTGGACPINPWDRILAGGGRTEVGPRACPGIWNFPPAWGSAAPDGLGRPMRPGISITGNRRCYEFVDGADISSDISSMARGAIHPDDQESAINGWLASGLRLAPTVRDIIRSGCAIIAAKYRWARGARHARA